MSFQVDETSKIPLYQQIVEWLDREITSGRLPAGRRLPTERMLSAKLNVARGTVKAAYIELKKRGKIERLQGKGTFVVGGSMEKELDTAVNAIRKTLDNLRRYSLGQQEIREIIKQEAWNRLRPEEKIRVAWIDCSPELVAASARQISQMCNVAAMPHLMEQVRKDSAQALASADLLATSMSHYQELKQVLDSQAGSREIVQVVLSANSRAIGAAARIKPGSRVAVLYQSKAFFLRVSDYLRDLGVSPELTGFCLSEPLAGFYQRMREFSLVIVPPEYPGAEGRKEAVMEACEKQGTPVLTFEYLLDNGSLIHLKERAQACWEERAAGL